MYILWIASLHSWVSACVAASLATSLASYTSLILCVMATLVLYLISLENQDKNLSLCTGELISPAPGPQVADTPRQQFYQQDLT